MVKEVSILDKYKDDAISIASRILDEYTKDIIDKSNTTIDQYVYKYVSDYVFKTENLKMHYDLFGYLSYCAKNDYSSDEIISKFNISSNKLLSEALNYTDIIEYFDDIVYNTALNVMLLLVNKVIKNKKFEF